jgi:hypothetical protein
MDQPQGRWELRLLIGLSLPDEREWLRPGDWTVRLVLGADETDGRGYDVDVSWDGGASDAETALNSVQLRARRA